MARGRFTLGQPGGGVMFLMTLMQSCPVAVTICVGTLEPANEVAIVEIETEESSGHAGDSGFVCRLVRGWGWAWFQQMMDSRG